jgi:hypothetical protein
MLVTEAQAKHKWCPATGAMLSGLAGADIPCRGPNCMVWQEAGTNKDGEAVGYCGLGGMPIPAAPFDLPDNRGRPASQESIIKVGDYLRNISGGPITAGFVVAVFFKRSGPLRYVVESEDGRLCVISDKNIGQESTV